MQTQLKNRKNACEVVFEPLPVECTKLWLQIDGRFVRAALLAITSELGAVDRYTIVNSLADRECHSLNKNTKPLKIYARARDDLAECQGLRTLLQQAA